MQIQATTKSLLILAAALGLGASAATAKDAGKLGFVFEAGASYVLTGYDVKSNATYHGSGYNVDTGALMHTGTISYASVSQSGDLDGGAGLSAFMGLSLGAHEFGIKGTYNDGGCFKWGSASNGTIKDDTDGGTLLSGYQRELDLDSTAFSQPTATTGPSPRASRCPRASRSEPSATNSRVRKIPWITARRSAPLETTKSPMPAGTSHSAANSVPRSRSARVGRSVAVPKCSASPRRTTTTAS